MQHTQNLVVLQSWHTSTGTLGNVCCSTAFADSFAIWTLLGLQMKIEVELIIISSAARALHLVGTYCQ